MNPTAWPFTLEQAKHDSKGLVVFVRSTYLSYNDSVVFILRFYQLRKEIVTWSVDTNGYYILVPGYDHKALTNRIAV